MAYITADEAKLHLKLTRDFTNTGLLNRIDSIVDTVTGSFFSVKTLTNEVFHIEEYSQNGIFATNNKLKFPAPIIEITSLKIDDVSQTRITSFDTNNNDYRWHGSELHLNNIEFSRDPFSNSISGRMGYETVPHFVKWACLEYLSIIERSEVSKSNYKEGSSEEAYKGTTNFKMVSKMLKRAYLDSTR